MKLLVDMNLSPDWVPYLAAANIESIHWSVVGPANAPDTEIIDFAAIHGYIVLTLDLDFGVILASTQVAKPSVVQVRSDDVNPEAIGKLVVAALHEGEAELKSGALITVDAKRSRLRLLPFPSRESENE